MCVRACVRACVCVCVCARVCAGFGGRLFVVSRAESDAAHGDPISTPPPPTPTPPPIHPPHTHLQPTRTTQELLDDILELRPQIFVSVPRLWNRIYDRVLATVRESNPISRALFERAFAYKRAALEAGDASGGRWGPLFDRLVFSKVRARVGGEVKYMTSGASPISAEVMMFLRVAFGCVVIEGYGMTESACTISIMRPVSAELLW